jgi:hypothetical protein
MTGTKTQVTKKLFPAVTLLAGLTLLVACGSGSNNKPAASPPSPPPPATLAAAASPAVATPAAGFQPATPASNPVQRVSGTVQSVSGNTVALSQGGSLTLSPQTAITVRKTGASSDLQSGKTVAITAKQQADGTLLASMIMVFPTAPGGSSFFGQRPLDGGNLMTNATVDKVQSNGFTATFPPDGNAQVTLSPDVQISVLAAGTAADVMPGGIIVASVLNGVAQTVSVQ